MPLKKSISKDNLLWNNFLSGDESAYGLIYEKYSKNLFILGLQFTSDRELVKDCVHDVFMKIYKNRANLKPVNNLKIYLFIALRNSIITAIKGQKIHTETLIESSDYSLTADYNTIEEILINKESEGGKSRLIAKLLTQLTSRQRKVIHYRFYEGLSIEEISTLMEMNYQSVQNLLQRSLRKITDYLKK